MNRATPYPLPLGSLAFCIDLDDARLPVERGAIYAVRHSLDGRMQETLIRRVAEKTGRVVLKAESSTPERFPDIALDKLPTDPAAPTFAAGLVYGVGGFIALLRYHRAKNPVTPYRLAPHSAASSARAAARAAVCSIRFAQYKPRANERNRPTVIG